GPEGWNSGEDHSNSGDAFPENKRKRRSRWSTNPEDKIVIPGMPTVIPSNLTESQQRQYVVHLQIEEFTRKLRTGELGIPANPEERSPSPEPIYNNEGKRMNTREYRTRKKLEEERHKLIQEALKLNPDFKPPGDYKPPIIRVNDKIMIPQEEHPEINFVGLLIGPRGNTLKNLEKETGAKIIIRGKGSVKDGKIGRKDGQPLPGEDEPLHAYITASIPENVTKAVEKIKEIIRQGIEVPEGQNDLRRQQLRELALLNGTLRENDGLTKLRQIAESQTIVTNTIICTICGGAGHIAQDCKQKRPGDSFRMQQAQNPAERAKMDSEYMSLMAELGEGPPPPKTESSTYSSPNYGRTLLANPPPNPMAINSPWQMNNRPPLGQPMPAAPLLSRPPYGMPMGPPQINPYGRLPVQGMNSPTQPPPGMQAPSGLITPMATSQSPAQQSPLLGGMGTVPQMQQGSDAGGFWQSPQVSQTQGLSSISNPGAASPGSMSVPPPPPASLLAPPPPPPPPVSNQMQSQPSPSWAHQLQAGKVPLLTSSQLPLPPPPPPPPPPPSSGRDSESAFTSGSMTPQQQTLLEIQNQVLQKQQQKVAMLTQSARMGEMASPSMAANRGNSQPSSATGGSDSSSNFSHPQSMRTGQDASFSGQSNQSMMMMNNQNLHNSSMPQGQMANRSFDSPFNYQQMSGPEGQAGAHYASMSMGQGGGAQNMMGPGNNHQNMMGPGNNHQSMMGQGNNHQSMMGQGNNHQSMMGQGNNHQSMMKQANNHQSMMGQGNDHQNMMNQRYIPQNMMNQGNNQQSMMGQGNNHQNVMNQGNNQQSMMNQGKTSQGAMASGNNSQNMMHQRNDSPMMNQGNHPQTWNNHLNNADIENNQLEKGNNCNMWN
ncbi:unnamed protein product, partial [Candidula unifasciata]